MKISKLINKTVIITAILSTILSFSEAQQQDQVAKYLRESDFNVEIYELAFAIPELSYLVKSDTFLMQKFQKRIERSLNMSNPEPYLQMQKKELHFLIKKYRNYPEYHEDDLTNFLTSMAEKTEKIKDDNPISIFSKYIEYPEQIDDVALMSLLLELDSEFWEQISESPSLSYRYNNWLKYGFLEFRYYPGVEDKAKKILNDRIIDYIKEKYRNSDNPELVDRSLSRISKVQARYK